MYNLYSRVSDEHVEKGLVKAIEYFFLQIFSLNVDSKQKEIMQNNEKL